jgi:serine O-acetyltransferase
MIHGFLFIVILVFVYLGIAIVFFGDELRSARERDPAAHGIIEVALLYPGIQAVIAYRLARVLWMMKFPLMPRLISQIARWVTGIEIHPGAKIGKGLFIDHGMGVVIGETAVIGDGVTLFQGVTLGGTGKETGKRHPSIGSNVVIGAGAKVLGNITIGECSYVGANAVVLRDVPRHSTVVGVPGHLTRQDGQKIDVMMDHAHVSDPIMQKLKDIHLRVRVLEAEENKSSDHVKKTKSGGR